MKNGHRHSRVMTRQDAFHRESVKRAASTSMARYRGLTATPQSQQE